MSTPSCAYLLCHGDCGNRLGSPVRVITDAGQGRRTRSAREIPAAQRWRPGVRRPRVPVRLAAFVPCKPGHAALLAARAYGSAARRAGQEVTALGVERLCAHTPST